MGELLTVLWTAMDLISLYFFWRAFFRPRVSKKQYVIAMAVLLAFFLVYFSMGFHQEWRIVIVLLSYVAVSLWVNQGKLHWHILIALLAYCFCMAMNNVFTYGACALLGIPLEVLVWRKLLFTVVVTTGRLAAIFLAWYIGHLWKGRRASALRGRWLLFTVLFFIASAVMLYIVFLKFQNAESVSAEVAVFSAIVFIVNVALFYLVDSLAKSTEQLKETALLNQQLDIQTEQILALEKSYQAQRQTTHDFRNQLQTISGLLSMGKSEEAEAYTQELLGQHTVRIFAVNSGHPVIDAVLNHKYQLCKAQDIDVQLQVNDLSKVNLSTDMLVVLLSNLLDNAIEGCCRLDGKRRIFISLIADDTLFLSIRNTSLPVTIQNGRIPTSKSDKDVHGYGLGRIQYILDKFSGEYSFTYQDGWFVYAAEIPLNQE
ncbi:MAG: sensor histidine kinase [Fusicatenibacter sp.]